MTNHPPSPFTRLLVPLDGSLRSEEALPYALALLGGTEGATITALHVIPDAEPLRKPLGQITKTADEMMAELTADAQASLQAAIERAGAATAGVQVDTVVRVGNVADSILDAADDLDPDAIVMAGSGRGNISRFFLGSVADRVARETTRPTLIVRQRAEGEDVPDDAGAHPSIARVVVPLDGSERGRAALPLATSLAAHLSVPVALVTVVEPTSGMSPAAVGGAGFSAQMYGGIVEEIEANAREQLAEVEKTVASSGLTVTTHLAHGPAVGAIIDLATPTDLIVMTSRGHGGIVRAVLGSVADTILREGPAPVLLVPSAE